MLNQMSSHRLVPNLNLWCHHILPLTCIKPERVWYLLKKKNSMKMVSSMFNMLPCWCSEGQISETIWGLVFENSTVSNSSIECSTNWLKGNGFSTKGFWWKWDLGESWDRKNHPRQREDENEEAERGCHFVAESYSYVLEWRITQSCRYL